MRISRQHALGRDEARLRVDRMAGELKNRFGLASDWSDDRLNIEGNGIRGHVAVGDSRVELDVELGFALKMMESTIRSAVEEQMDKHLA